jgi:hypothetical protein
VETLRTFATLFHELSREETFAAADANLQARLLKHMTTVAPKVSGLMKEDKLAGTWASFNMIRMGIFRPLADLPVFNVANPLAALAVLADRNAMVKLVDEVARVMPMGALFFAQAGHLQAGGKLAEAEVLYRKAIDAPSLVPVGRRAKFVLLGVVGKQYEDAPPGPFKDKKRDEALALLREVSRGGPYSAEFSDTFIGWSLSLDEPALGLAVAEDWVRQKPDDRAALLARIRVEERLGAWGRQGATIDRMLKLNPRDPDAHNIRTVAAANQRVYGVAIASALSALRYDPRNKTARENIESVGRSIDSLMAGLPYLREKARLWEALHLAHTGHYGCGSPPCRT